ncbi:hypothetical protein K2173_020485 [Erythroxylum novogranatense]|uniref:Homeobox domain-containing protein n=1 Tax=Erythroxylum novogranatense TaxID=1862640 RepID=A0AAV8TIF7_9ROSI|nr:hypothetical protein K2173_020485 [Erythroxylum novogranatense]
MAQNLESYHVPQRNRKSKLRVTQANQEQQGAPAQGVLMNTTLQNIYYEKHQPLTCSLYTPCQAKDLNCRTSTSLGGSMKQNGEARSVVPLGPFTGYASILKTSRFLKPAQQILDELCGVNCEGLPFSLDWLSDSEVMRESMYLGDQMDNGWKNLKLTLMLEEVCRGYKLYYHQMQSVASSFRIVAGLANAAPYVCYAIKLVFKHFTCLKNAIFDQIKLSGKGKTSGFCVAQQQHIQNKTLAIQHHVHVWRSQRGLPEHAVAVLKSWLFEHFLHPYPSDSEKQTLSQQTGLSRTQVSNWFINARVRLWKPMVEEVHVLESKRGMEETRNEAVMASNCPDLTRRPEAEGNQIKRLRNDQRQEP